MEKSKLVSVPSQLQCPYFFGEHQMKLHIEPLIHCEELFINDYFPYEVAYYVGIDVYRPWEHANDAVAQLIDYWKPLSQKLSHLFEKRNRMNVQKPMKQGISLLIQCLFWINNKPVIFYEQSIKDDDLKWKPVNIKERLEFILHRPNVYHSFVQLNELMIELEKQFHIKRNKING